MGLVVVEVDTGGVLEEPVVVAVVVATVAAASAV